MITKQALALFAAGSTALLACHVELEEADIETTQEALVVAPVSQQPHSVDPIDSVEPIDPGDSVDPIDPGDSVEPVDPAPTVRHEGIGSAIITFVDGVLHATNMRSLDDGVRSVPSKPSVEWLLEPEWDPAVSAIDLTALNSRLSGSGVEGNIRFERVANSEWVVEASFPRHDAGDTAPGPDQPYIINVYSNGSVVGSARVTPGETDIRMDDSGTQSCPLCEWLARRNASDDSQRYSWKLHATSGVITVVVDGESFTGDVVEFIEAESHEFRGGFDAIELRGNANVTYKSEKIRAEGRVRPAPKPTPVEPVPSDPAEPVPSEPVEN